MSIGFVKETLDVTVAGIVRAIQLAHDNMKAGNLFTGSGELLDANINRSPSAYLLNPEAERNQ